MENPLTIKFSEAGTRESVLCNSLSHEFSYPTLTPLQREKKQKTVKSLTPEGSF